MKPVAKVCAVATACVCMAAWFVKNSAPESEVAKVLPAVAGTGSSFWSANVPGAAGPVETASDAAARDKTATSAAAASSAPALREGLTPEEWSKLQTALADHPRREEETKRIVAFLQYQRQIGRLRELQASNGNRAPTSEMQTLARSIDAGVQQRLDQREITAGEAMQLRTATLGVLEPDPGARPKQLAAWRDAQVAAAAAAQPANPDPRDVEFFRQQQAILARWHALPEAQRDPTLLELQLEQLRAKAFSTPR